MSELTFPDYTNFDFSNAPLYKSKPNEYEARRLSEPYTIIQSWGTQHMEAGDWVLLKPGSNGEMKESGVGAFAFDSTYVELGDGRVRQEKYIRAIFMDHEYRFLNPDNPNELSKGPVDTYFTLNMSRLKEVLYKNGIRDVMYYRPAAIETGFDLVSE